MGRPPRAARLQAHKGAFQRMLAHFTEGRKSQAQFPAGLVDRHFAGQSLHDERQTLFGLI
jgi:hypothetical protein